MAWLSALACDAVAAQDRGRVAPFQPPLSSSALIDLLARTVNNHPAVQAQNSLLNAAQQGASNARWQYFPTPSIWVQSAQASVSDPAYLGDSRVAVLVLTTTVEMLTCQRSVLNYLMKPITRGLTGALNER